MQRSIDLALTGLAPIIWGTTYIVTTQYLPDGYPITAAVLRALPAGLLLLLMTRQLPTINWLPRMLVLGALNFAIFWAALFIAAYRLPGGVAATLGAIQPLIVLLLARAMLGAELTIRGILAAIGGMIGVALLVLGPNAQLDVIGVSAAFIGAMSMAGGTILTRKWQPPVSPLTFTAWQLVAGGLLLLPAALIFEPRLPMLNWHNIAGFTWLGLFGAAASYYVWFRGIRRLGPTSVTGLGFLSPLTAVFVGWIFLGEALSLAQSVGALIVLVSVGYTIAPKRKPRNAVNAASKA